MKHERIKYLSPFFLFLIILFITGCKEETVSYSSSLRLAFSADTVRFDTVFTTIGSSTRAVMVYNPNRNAVRISDVSVSTPYFQINLDGENDLSRLHDLTLNGGDSLFLFVRTTIDPLQDNAPVFLTDSICFLVNGNKQHVWLEAYGQNIHLLRHSTTHTQYDDFHFLADLPYLVFDTMEVMGTTLVDAGVTIYMHAGASLLLNGAVSAQGTQEKPIRITGDRLDKLFPKVPYQMASGQWGGIYLIADSLTPAPHDTLNYVEILSGNIGLYVYSPNPTNPRHITIGNARIHNHARYGLVLLNTHTTLYNSEISNCASFCIYLAGGTHRLTHNTIASFFGYPYSNLNIHTTGRQDVPAVYVSLYDEQTEQTQLSLYNNIITGARLNNLGFDSVPDAVQGIEVANNYLLADSLPDTWAHDNIYAATSDTVFRNTYYLYKEYNYYDFRLDSVSPARGVGAADYAAPYPTDRLGIPRTEPIDAGCYQWTE